MVCRDVGDDSDKSVQRSIMLTEAIGKAGEVQPQWSWSSTVLQGGGTEAPRSQRECRGNCKDGITSWWNGGGDGDDDDDDDGDGDDDDMNGNGYYSASNDAAKYSLVLQELICLNNEQQFEVTESLIFPRLGQAARERATRASAPVAGNTSTAHHHHHRSLYQHPNDYDHLRALDESITRIDLGSVRAPKWDAHNVTMPAYPPQDVHKRQDQPQPQYAESSGHFKQPYPPVQWNAPYAPRQFSDQYSYRGGQMQNHPNRSFAQPFNQSFNNSQHVTQAYSYHNQRPLHPSTYNYTSYPVYPPQQYVGPHPPVINPNRGPNSNPQNSILSDLTNEKWVHVSDSHILLMCLKAALFWTVVIIIIIIIIINNHGNFYVN